MQSETRVMRSRNDKGKTYATAIAALACVLAMATTASAVTILPNAFPTIHLAGPAPQSTIAYHPGFDQYYASQTGYPQANAYVWDASGALLQTHGPLNIDARSWNYNPNTGNVEMIGYSPSGLWTMGLDGAGLLTGGNANTNPALGSGLLPVYDAARDRFYSYGAGSSVYVTSGVNGSQLGTITLDLAPAGSPTLTSYFVGYDPTHDVLITMDNVNNRALVHDLGGVYLGASQLPIAAPGSYFSGYANGQLFLRDSSGPGGTAGFNIFVPEPTG